MKDKLAETVYSRKPENDFIIIFFFKSHFSQATCHKTFII